MEINLKLNLPSIFGNENHNLNDCTFPKSLNITYLFDFGNFDFKKALKSIESAPATQTKNIVLNINDDKTAKLNEKKNEQREENHEPKTNEDLIKEKKEDEPNIDDFQAEEDAQENEMENIRKKNEVTTIPQEKKYEENYGNKTGKNFTKNAYREKRDAASRYRPPLLVEKEKENDKGFAEEVTEDIYIVGIKEDITEEDLKNSFLCYGDVVDCKIFRDKFTQKIKGSGIVKFKEKISAFNAVNDAKEVLCKDHPLKLRYSKRNIYYGEKEESRNKNEKKFCGRIRERSKEKEDGEILYGKKW
jgi:hypothetical protein